LEGALIALDGNSTPQATAAAIQQLENSVRNILTAQQNAVQTYQSNLGGGGSFTAAANASLKFTDLKNAYTNENMITSQVADVRVEARNFEQYSSSRKTAPAPLSNDEMAGVMAAEAATAKREEQRRLRAAQEDSLGSQYFERMKQLVITNK
jgi:hypothetical protein